MPPDGEPMTGRPALSDGLPMPEWQRRRRLQLSDLALDAADTASAVLSDLLPMEDWQRRRDRQVRGLNSSGGRSAPVQAVAFSKGRPCGRDREQGRRTRCAGAGQCRRRTAASSSRRDARSAHRPRRDLGVRPREPDDWPPAPHPHLYDSDRRAGLRAAWADQVRTRDAIVQGDLCDRRAGSLEARQVRSSFVLEHGSTTP